MILALAFGIVTVFPEQKLPLYIVFTLFVAVAIIMNVWFTHQNIKSISLSLTNTSHTFSLCLRLLYIGFVIYTLTIGSYDVLPIIIFAISIVLVQILENILGISIRNTRPSNKQLKVISEQSAQQFKVISLILVSVSIVFILLH